MSLVPTIDKQTTIRFSGAVYTPLEISTGLVSIVRNLLPNRPLNILEPSVGDGSFFYALMPNFNNSNLTAVDIDDTVISKLKTSRLDSKSSVNFVIDDFIRFALTYIKAEDKPYDLVIGNPPFIRKHNFSETFKENLNELAELAAYPIKDLKNSWVGFVLAASKIVSDNGLLAFIVPYELLTVEYGQKALDLLLKEFDCIDIYVSQTKAFPSIDQDAVILIAHKKSNNKTGLYIHRVKEMSNLFSNDIHKLNFLEKLGRGLELNAYLLADETVCLLRRLQADCKTVNDFAGSAPGIVSAANEYFILKKSEIEKQSLKKYALPILKKGSFSSYKPIFTRADFSKLEENEPCYLLSIKGDFSSLDPVIQAYINNGVSKGFNLRYKCRNRKNWYDVPIVPRESGFFFKRSHEFPRVCINEANVYLTDTSYGIKVRNGYTMKGICYSFYNSLTLLFAETNGRFYGGGVLELSPTEFRGLPLVYHEPTEEDFSNFLEVHDKAQGNVEIILNFGDNWLQKKLEISNEEIYKIRQAWLTVRAHRMRHGGRKARLSN